MNRFQSAVSLQELQDGTELIVDTENVDLSSDDEEFDESFQSFKDEYLKAVNADGEEDSAPYLSSFENMALKMQPISEDGQIKKLQLKPGVGSVIPENSVVLINYNAFLENQDVPYDSTYQRKSPFRFLLGYGKVFLGMDIAVRTMRLSEVSSFIFPHDYAYGHLGCAPRIPPMATLYYEVEVLSFVDSGDAIEYEQMSFAEKRRAPFPKVLSAAKGEHQMGNTLFQKKSYSAAASRYRKAILMLEDVCVADEEEDLKCQSLSLKLYLNLAVCHTKLKNSKKCRINAQNVLKMKPNHPKALYHMGNAYLLDGEYDDALRYMLKAQNAEPYNESISMQISEIEKKKKSYEENYKVLCANMFGLKCKVNNEFNESKEFVDAIKECVQGFKESEENEYCFPSAYTPSQIDDIKTVASLYDVQFIQKFHNDIEICKLMKK